MHKKDSSWGKVAGWYDELLESNPGSYQEEVILPNILRLVEPKAGMTILDLACGQGYFSRAFFEKGAKIIASDISKELIELAKNRSDKAIDFHVGSADDISFLEEKSVDSVVIVLAIQNMDNIERVFTEVKRVLQPQGKLFIVLNHPSFRIPKESSWQWDGEKKKQYRRIDSYMSESKIDIDMTPGENVPSKKIHTITFHRPLQVYFKALNKAGFAVTRLEEWISNRKSQEGPRSSEEDRMRKEIPLFMALVAKIN